MPQSLIGQIALVMAAALLVAQAINFSLVRSERQRLNQAQLEAPVIARFVESASRLLDTDRVRPIANRRGRVALGGAAIVTAAASDADLAGQLSETAAASGIGFTEARAALSDTPPPLPPAAARRLKQREERFRALLLSGRLPDGRWVNGQMLIMRPSAWPLVRQLGATALIYFLLLAGTVLVAARLVSPLRDLTNAAQRFRGMGEAPHVEPRGPADIRRAIEAFNRMGARVGALIEEKDRMLGAIGHDLRTPLASLRIRAETIEPPEERERIVATIEDMAGLLEDAVSLARSGRSSETPRPIDIGALVDAVVEEFRELGHEVTFDGGPRTVASARANLLRRAVRNLIDNAVKYAGAANLSVERRGDCAVISVLDRGPGIPQDQLLAVQEPFVRLEQSRSRETGGTGLGVTLARAAATLHGGELELLNREGGGLVARLMIPCAG